jgi:hypothetical protein
MIVNNFDIIRITGRPSETYPPLIIDADAVLTYPLPFKRLQLVSRRLHHILKMPGAIQKKELTTRLTFNRLEPGNPSVVKKHCRIFALECFYHGVMILRVA